MTESRPPFDAVQILLGGIAVGFLGAIVTLAIILIFAAVEHFIS